MLTLKTLYFAMALNSYIYKFRQLIALKKYRLCRTISTNSEEHLSPEDPGIKIPSRLEQKSINQEPSPASLKRLKRHNKEINDFFEQHPEFKHLKKWVPAKVLETRYYKNPDHIYLVSPKIAKSIAEHIKQRIQGETFLGESNAGFGLISKALLDEGVSPLIRIYENKPEFQEYINENFVSKDQIILHPRNFFSLRSYASLDSLYSGTIVSEMIKGVTMRSWRDEPAITLVGTLTTDYFLKYLMKCLVLQKEPITYGRIDLFVITYLDQWKIYTATTKSISRQYKSSSILLQTFFDMELIDKYPRKYFLPWEQASRKDKRKKGNSSDLEDLCLVRLTMKKDFPIKADYFLPYYCFILLLYGRGVGSIISTCEKLIPNSGVSIIAPKLPHKDYFEELNIFTKFRELSPTQLISVFEELAAHEDFESSPFMDMVEQELVKTETIDTDLHEYNEKQ